MVGSERVYDETEETCCAPNRVFKFTKNRLDAGLLKRGLEIDHVTVLAELGWLGLRLSAEAEHTVDGDAQIAVRKTVHFAESVPVFLHALTHQSLHTY